MATKLSHSMAAPPPQSRRVLWTHGKKDSCHSPHGGLDLKELGDIVREKSLSTTEEIKKL